MRMTDTLSNLIDRLSRLQNAERWLGGLNPAQVAALEYLARANRFSRMPSAVADYLASTRGTVSQTLKALAHKGLVAETPDRHDRRARRYDLTQEGWALISALNTAPFRDLPAADRAAAETALRGLISALLGARGGRSFGLCRSCRHHRATGAGAHCALLDVALKPDEPDQICQEHAAA